ncbi:Lysophospholipase 1 [Madurella fahalii]|uniref:Lysophospholipase n=1 Tax=Madurella fahalii TaxID=1157608 RepID=A0ABQ0FZT3_9PEZI
MHLQALLPLALLQPLLTSAEPVRIPPRHNDLAISPRARPNAPSGSYAPAQVPCPDDKPRIRSANALSKSETDWLSRRRPATVDPMIDFLRRANIDGFDAEAYINRVASDVTDLPNIGIAVSGGGYRALMNGAGFVSAADSRTPGSTGNGGIGGLLQASTYLAGLSGGGWLVTSIYANNFSSVETLRQGREDSNIWKFSNSIFDGPDMDGIFDTPRYWGDVADQVRAKRDAGFETSITDYWGRALAYQLIDAPDGGPAYTFSSIALDDEFSNARTPFPILVADGRAPGTQIISLNATVFEFNPFEMGSFDPTTYGFAPMEYLASNFTGGVIPSDGKCVRGFDSASYVFGTSSSLFNAFLVQNISSIEGIPDFLIQAATGILEDLDQADNDIAQYAPNPFLGWNEATNPSHDSYELDLVDGGLDLQNIPLHPLIQPLRSVDVIFAVDSSADTTYNWPNGTALRASYDRSQSDIANGTLFPPVPDDKTFISLGLNNRPTFFGCDPANFTLASPDQVVPPLIVYIPNAPYTAMSNVSTFTPSYTAEQRDAIIRNGFDAATQGNGTLDTQWAKCVACAVVSRSLARTRTPAPPECASCFERYCWNGETAATLTNVAASGEYEPTFKIADASQSAGSSMPRSMVGLVVGLFAMVVIL